SLVVDFLARVISNVNIQPKWQEDTVILSAAFKADLEEAINEEINTLGKDLLEKIGDYRLRDFPIHINDRKMLEKLLERKIEKRFSETVAEILQNTRLTFKDLDELSRVTYKTSRNDVSIIYGSYGDLPIPQPLLTERFESSYAFMYGTGGKSLKIRGTKPWIILLLSGYALSYAGYLEDTINYIHVHEPTLRDSELARFIASRDGLIPHLTRLNVPLTPKTAYILYIASDIAKKIQEQARLLEIVKGRQFQIEFERVRWSLTTYTTIERFVADLHSILLKLLKLDKGSISWINQVSRECLFRRTSPMYSVYLRLISLLYNTFTGAGDPIDTLYFMGRVFCEKYERESKRKDSYEFAERTRSVIKDMTKVLL
ncbi:hypothetical protein KEJ48_07490, partial [Candidatus Bathyarchaeota archaeon]|nr:hypothetical protein [Candidatus Bathyarchaeota archaeon]